MSKKLYSFRETNAFTKRLANNLTEESYFALQNFLHEKPIYGDLIRGGGGIRKLRWKAEGRGKRGGLRIIYYLADEQGYIYLLTLYAKNEQEDLSAQQLKEFRQIVEEWL